jgi:hypothetical protein
LGEISQTSLGSAARAVATPNQATRSENVRYFSPKHPWVPRHGRSPPQIKQPAAKMFGIFLPNILGFGRAAAPCWEPPNEANPQRQLFGIFLRNILGFRGGSGRQAESAAALVATTQTKPTRSGLFGILFPNILGFFGPPGLKRNPKDQANPQRKCLGYFSQTSRGSVEGAHTS